MAESQETSDYPGALDNWVTLTNKEDLAEQSDINKMKAAIEAVQTELGTDPAGTATDVTSRLSRMMNGAGAFAQGTAFPTSPTPVEGQVFYRTDENTPYVYDGSNWIPFVGSSYELFTASGTFTVPGGITTVYLTLCGSGASGSSGFGGTARGGGSGAQSVINFPVSVTPAESVTVTVGSARPGGTLANPGLEGLDGIASSFGSYISALGGERPGDGGLAFTSTGNASGTTGGSIKKLDGGNAATASGTSGGGGGGSYFGAGGNGGTTGVAGAAGTGFGSGGGGGGANAVGGASTAGFVLVSW